LLEQNAENSADQRTGTAPFSGLLRGGRIVVLCGAQQFHDVGQFRTAVLLWQTLEPHVRRYDFDEKRQEERDKVQTDFHRVLKNER